MKNMFESLRPANLAVLSIVIGAVAFTGCTSSGGGDNSGGDPTLTTYAPQTLDRVEMILSSNDGGTMRFLFEALTRSSPEFETGAFTYYNDSAGWETDVNADTITNGNYSYQVITAETGILTLTGGEGAAASQLAFRFVGDVSGTDIYLDFGNNSGNSSSNVDALIEQGSEISGTVTVNGFPLPLNYNGKNDGPVEPVLNPSVRPTLDAVGITFTNSDDSHRPLTFTRIAGNQFQESGNVIDDDIDYDLASDGIYYDFDSYIYKPDLEGGNGAELELDGEVVVVENGQMVFSDSVHVTLSLTFLALDGGNATSNSEPFPISPRPFIVIE